MAIITLTKTTTGRNLWRSSARGVNPKVKYFALGTGTTAPSTGDTKLQNEVFRKAVTSYTDGATGEEIINGYISPTDAVGVNIGEVGIFAGDSANSNANTGVLIGRGLLSHPGKTNTESIVLQFDLQF